MRTFICTLLVTTLCLTSFATSNSNGFTVKRKAINPACINLTSTWLSDHGILVRSIIPSNCQSSNQAFAGQSAKINSQGQVCYVQKQQHFCYRVIGKTASGLFVITTQNWSDDGHGTFSDWRVYRYQRASDYNAAVTNKTWPKVTEKQRVLTLLISQPAGDLSNNTHSLKNFHLKGNTLYATLGSKSVHWDLGGIKS